MSTTSFPNTTTNTEAPTKLYELIASYDFESDSDFCKGLGAILGHPETPALDAELIREDDVVLQAKCFYISRKNQISPPVDFSAYKSWVEANNSLTRSSTSAPQQPAEEATTQKSSQSPNSTTAPSTSSSAGKADAEPAYPSSFSHIVELITTGQPIPGIEDIPDTVLSGHEKPSKVARRRKPWEKTEVENSDDNASLALQESR
ncbi:hypothetical protein BGW36DRAFT_305735 [Talaromyces proteolyticus]|uniref:Uncharacterized protein n=1 Tax=Talaromyces proteolyticus TaxID=1131652 RepID=A0AAD4KFX4_9EURO|nr:uncharacterized protein BGW36DRAFT_305735 [Talaromyces proteolyticus]KAH8691106.1 hypothetical protein BGW36DRAFT_305735 [Talaromyces proteolyticus]